MFQNFVPVLRQSRTSNKHFPLLRKGKDRRKESIRIKTKGSAVEEDDPLCTSGLTSSNVCLLGTVMLDFHFRMII